MASNTITKDLGIVTAYAEAVAGGYQGTRAQFQQMLARLANSYLDYSELENKPSINNVELVGNKTTSQLNISYNDLKDKPTISGGTTNYTELSNKPSINGVTLTGNLTAEQLGISSGEATLTEYTDLLSDYDTTVSTTSTRFSVTNGALYRINGYGKLYVVDGTVTVKPLASTTSIDPSGKSVSFFTKHESVPRMKTPLFVVANRSGGSAKFNGKLWFEKASAAFRDQTNKFEIIANMTASETISVTTSDIIGLYFIIAYIAY